MNVTPASSQAAANPAFSAKNPYPGWIASAPAPFAVSSSLSTLR